MGPVTNFIIAGIVYATLTLIPSNIMVLGQLLEELMMYFAVLNVGLGLFNLLISAIPMDGGRLLRAILGLYMPFPRATRISVSLSKVIAVIMGLIGLAIDPWLVVIAFFVYITSSSELEESLTRYILEDVSLKQIPSSPIVEVSSRITVQELLDIMLTSGQTDYLVRENSKDLGVVTISDIQSVPKSEYNQVTVNDIMTTSIITIPRDASAKDALQKIRENEIGRLFVTDAGVISGVLTRSDLLNFIQIKSVQKSSKMEPKEIGSNLQSDPAPN